MKTVHVGDRVVGEGEPALVVAEIGINHNGDIDLAHQLVDAAAKAGADAVKFQNYHTEDFVTDRSLTYKYVVQGREVVEKQYEMFKRCELALPVLKELRKHSAEKNLIFFSTPTSEKGVHDLVDLGVPMLKNGSDYLQHLRLIQTMAGTGLPCVISTGMGTREDVDDAIRAFREGGGRELILLVCTSLYPAPPKEVNLRRIPAMARMYDLPVGLSDHTQGIEVAIGAVALGACIIEKHFTLDTRMQGPDHRFSADPSDFKALVNALRKIEESLGESDIGPTPSEIRLRQQYRLSCVAARDLPAGHRLSASDIMFSRPGTGMPPKEEASLLKKKLTRDVDLGHVFMSDDFEI
jgi:N-acetylneuraminate synthase/N,N'-diacetyllegionaminate synthase